MSGTAPQPPRAEDSRAQIARLVAAYVERHPEEEAGLAPLVAQLRRPEPVDDRRTMPGHVTAAALLLHPARRELLLVHHRVLQRWLQPGGHLDRGEQPAEAALRELVEETGVAGAALHPWHAAHALPDGALPPLDIDIHAIPAHPRGVEPPHRHLDFRYAFVIPPARGGAAAGPAEPALSPELAEVSALRWWSVDALAAADGGEPPVPGLQRAARKLRAILDADSDGNAGPGAGRGADAGSGATSRGR
jgi:8-oxo-dGTP pyrophosphatase MutT (NUDIX family)